MYDPKKTNLLRAARTLSRSPAEATNWSSSTGSPRSRPQPDRLERVLEHRRLSRGCRELAGGSPPRGVTSVLAASRAGEAEPAGARGGATEAERVASFPPRATQRSPTPAPIAPPRDGSSTGRALPRHSSPLIALRIRFRIGTRFAWPTLGNR